MRIIYSLVLIIFAVFLFGGHSAFSSEASAVVTDMAGRQVRIPQAVNRIVCIGPGTLRLITYLEATDAVAGIEGGFEKDSPAGRPYRIAHPGLATLPVIGQASPSPRPNPEAILGVRPDIIFISYVEGRTADGLEEKTGIPVVVLSYGDLAAFNTDDVFASLRLAGGVIGKKDRAEAVIQFIKDCEKDLKKTAEKIPADKRPRVYVGGLGYRGMQGITSTEYAYPAFRLLRAENVAAEPGKKGQVFVDREKILEWDPDIIFIDGGGLDIVRDDFRKGPGFYGLLKAVRNDNVYGLFPYNYYTTNIDTALADAYFIGKLIYPEAFEDMIPARKADEIYSFLVGAPVYDAMKDDWKEAFTGIRLDEKR